MRQVIYLTGYSTTVYAVDRHGARALGRFRHDESGYRALRALLAQKHGGPVHILADLIEEEFRQQDIPHTFGTDRKRLLERHGRKLYRTTPFRLGRVIGRERKGRRDDRALFSALTNPGNVQPLIDILEQLRLPLAGIHSLPVISRGLLRPMQLKAANVLIITEQPDGGLRETFVHKGHVKFSRLAPVPAATSGEYCLRLQKEIHKALRYLHTLRLLPRDETLDVYSLTDAEHAEAIRDFCHDEELLRFHAAEIGTVARRLGFRNYPEGSHSDALFAYLLVRQSTGNHYAAPPHLRNYRTWQTRVGLRAATWLLAVGGLAWSGINTVNGVLTKREAAMLAGSTATVSASYVQLTRQLPVQPEEARAMREALQLAEQLESHSVRPDALFSLVGTSFAEQPGLEMEKFSWFASDSATARQAVDLSSMDPSVPVPVPRYVVASIEGRLARFDGSYLAAQEQISRLTESLRRQPGVVEVNIERAPLDTRPDAQIQGQLDNGEGRERADFELRLVVEMNHEPV